MSNTQPGIPRIVSVFLFVLVVAAGCGADGVKTVSVSGTVYLDGQPVEGVEVYFASENHAGYGVTAVDGTYELVQGAEPGENRLRFSKVVNSEFNDPENGMDAGQLEALAMAHGGGPGVRLPGQMIPSKYSDPALSKIVFEVPDAGTGSADFRLTSKWLSICREGGRSAPQTRGFASAVRQISVLGPWQRVFGVVRIVLDVPKCGTVPASRLLPVGPLGTVPCPFP